MLMCIGETESRVGPAAVLGRKIQVFFPRIEIHGKMPWRIPPDLMVYCLTHCWADQNLASWASHNKTDWVWALIPLGMVGMVSMANGGRTGLVYWIVFVVTCLLPSQCWLVFCFFLEGCTCSNYVCMSCQCILIVLRFSSAEGNLPIAEV